MLVDSATGDKGEVHMYSRLREHGVWSELHIDA